MQQWPVHSTLRRAVAVVVSMRSCTAICIAAYCQPVALYSPQHCNSPLVGAADAAAAACSYKIMDGKQRLTSLLTFIAGRPDIGNINWAK
jgi:hypothetical protein